MIHTIDFAFSFLNYKSFLMVSHILFHRPSNLRVKDYYIAFFKRTQIDFNCSYYFILQQICKNIKPRLHFLFGEVLNVNKSRYYVTMGNFLLEWVQDVS